MKKHLKYLRYVIRHKWFVLTSGVKLGVSLHQLIIHDWTKFLPCEWFPYTNYFYGDYPPLKDVEHIPHIYSGKTKEDVTYDFDMAWLHHQNYNKHHWQYWSLTKDTGETSTLAMPKKHIREMVADWMGAGKALGKPDTKGWYLKNRDRIVLHPYSRFLVEEMLGVHGE